MFNSLGAWFRRQSVARKLTTTALTTTGVTLMAACTVFAIYDYVNSRSSLVRDVTMLADIVGTNSTAALTFKDATAAADTLRATAVNEHILDARLFTRDGTLLATYMRPGISSSPTLPDDARQPSIEAVALFEGSRLRVVRPIVLNREIIGSIAVESDTTEVWTRLARFATIVAGTLFGAFWITLGLSRATARLIFDPVAQLIEAMRLVRDGGRYDIRADAGNDDEIGELVNQFNAMLSDIQKRDQQLVLQQDSLERTVDVRTAELQTSNEDLVKALDRAMKASRALQSAGVGIWDMDYTTGVIQWSETLEALYGLQPGTFGGTFEAFVERIHPDDRESVLETLGKAMKSGADFSVQHRTLWPDGAVRWLSGAGRIHLGEHSEPVRGIGISLDVTERRMLEEQYQQAQKMEAIGRLAGGVAHDFNNLLTVILGTCELLLADLDPDDPRQADIAEIQKAGASAAGLTRQLLAFSRKQIIEPTLLDLNVLVADMRAMLGRLIREDVKVVLGLRPELARVKADRGQVEQIVMNLAVNAGDAMPAGGTLTIETANVELDEHYMKTHPSVKPGPYVALTVTDTGTGMTPQVLARLFEPFFTTKEVGKGTGLGLATVHGIATQSGGSVDVYSEIGSGTSFTVYLPRADAAEMVAEAPLRVARPRAGMETVLVVEDADGLRELARRLLQRRGYTVLVAANADEALRLFEGNASIDLLLTDVVMPGTSGPALTRQLVERRPALKVIYMSGYTDEAIVHHGVLNPGIAFLNKPFTSDTLGRKIREVLDR